MPRNSSGTYSLPAGNPVMPDTLIEVNWANPTMADLAQALSDSLDRQGRGSMLAPLKFADGSLAAPGISFSGESSTGFYRPSSGTLNVAVQGALAMSFTGTTIEAKSPFSAPSISAASMTVDDITFSGGVATFKDSGELLRLETTTARGGGDGWMQFNDPDGEKGRVGYAAGGDALRVWNRLSEPILFLTSDLERMRIAANGNVGIGIDPAARLHVEGHFVNTVGDKTIALYPNDTNGATIQWNDSVTDWRVTTGTEWWLQRNGSVRFKIGANGYVGVGDGTPISALDLNQGGVHNTITVRTSGGFNSALSLMANGNGSPTSFDLIQGNGSNAYVMQKANAPMMFFTNGVERMRIPAAGGLGIGTTNPESPVDIFQNYMTIRDGTSKLHIGTATLLSGVVASGVALRSDSGPIYMGFTGTVRMRMESDGRLALNTNGAPSGVQGIQIGHPGTTGEQYLRLVSNTNDLYFGQTSGTIFGYGPGQAGYVLQVNRAPLCVGTLDTSSLVFGTAGVPRMAISSVGTITDGVAELGWKIIPFHNGGTTVTGEIYGDAIGKLVRAGGNVSMHGGNFGAGSTFSIFSTVGAAITLSGTGGTQFIIAGTAVTKAAVTLQQWAIITVIVDSASYVLVTGAGVS